MTAVFVQFSGAAQTTVVAVFSSVQDAEAYPHQGTVAADDARYIAFLSPPVDRVAENVAAVQAAMEAAARAKGYDNILSAISYAQQPTGAPFQAEGAAFLAWRSDVWTEAFAVLAQVKLGSTPMPTPAEAVAAMPVLVLP
jgi:hypothetical protein